MNNPDSISRSRALAERVVFHILKVLAETDGPVPKSKVVERLQGELQYDIWERAETSKAKKPRWKNALWYTADMVKAGFIMKSRGKWQITPEGRAALSMSPGEVYDTITAAYKKWHATHVEDDDNGTVGLFGAEVRGQIMRHGMRILDITPGKCLPWEDILRKVQAHLPEELLEELNDYDPEWPSNYGYRSFYHAACAGWLHRSAGKWTLTESGVDALRTWADPAEFAAKAKQAAGTGGAKEKLPYLGHTADFTTIPPTLYQAYSVSVGQLVGEIQHGTLALPDIQRPFVWKNTKVRDLLDSMYRGFPFGFLLTWKSPDVVTSHAIGFDNSNGILPHALVIDGQQRLTSLYAVMTGRPVVDEEFRERKIRISFHPIRGVFAVSDATIERNPEWLPDVSAVYTEKMGALAVVKAYLMRLDSAREITDEHRSAAEQNISRLVNLKNISVSVLQVGADADEEQVAEIFVRINSRGQNLRQADFILTLLAVFWEQGRENLEDFARACRHPVAGGKPSPFNRKLHPGPNDLVRVAISVGHRRAKLSAAYQILRGKDPKSGSITRKTRDENIFILQQAQAQVLNVANWQEFLKVLSAAGYRHKKLLQSEITALYAYSLFLIGRESLSVPLKDLRRVIGRWFMMSTITGRYVGGSSESMMEEDLARIREINTAESFVETLEQAMSAELTNDFWAVTLPSRMESSNTRTLSSFFAAQGVLGANALYSGLTVAELLNPDTQSTKEDLEIHHLFPKGWLKAQGIDNPRDFNQVANLSLLEWSANIEVNYEDPAKYAPRLEKRLHMSSEQIAEMYRLHALPDLWWELGYSEFLDVRRRAIAGLIREAFGRIS